MIYKRGCDKKGPSRTCSRCGERGSCGFYWYKFMWQGKLIRESTHQGNDKVARQMESAHRTRLAEEQKDRRAAAERLGCAPDQLVPCTNCRDWFNRELAIFGDDKKFCSSICRTEWVKKHRQTPRLADFMDTKFKPWTEATFREKPRTRIWYRGGIRRLSEFAPLANARLNEIGAENVHAYIAKRQTDRLNVTSINRELQILKRILHLAVEWGAVDAAIKIKLLPGERRRERVVTPEEEARYLNAAAEPLASIATALVGTGMRPEECFRLRWENVTWLNGRYGTLRIEHGKTAAARRMIPMTPRIRHLLEMRWESAGKPADGWIWPALTQSGHVEPSSLRTQHARAFDTIAKEAAKRNERPVRPFVLYSLRHTFLTRLGQSGCDAWTLARIAGHSSIAISSRYVHPGEEAILAAVERLGGHRIGHSEKSPNQLPVATISGSAVQ